MLYFAIVSAIITQIILLNIRGNPVKISTSTFGAIKPYGMEEGLKMLAEAGFEAIDYSMTQNAINWEEDFFKDPLDPAFAE